MVTTLTPEQILSEIASPAMYPQALDGARAQILVIRMRGADYRAASFLDDRILSANTAGGWVPFGKVAEAASHFTSPRPLHFIFHIGHVGSTLLSRLLEEIDGVLPLREPMPLRALADAPNPAMLETFLRLWSRGFDGTKSVVLKATSSAARLAQQLLDARPHAHAVYMYLPAEPYLATLLAGENSPVDLQRHQPERSARLAASGRAAPPITSLGELAAMSWLAETTTMHAVVERHKLRVMPLNFDALLSNLPDALARVAAHLGLHADTARLAAVAKSPALLRYSKAPEYEYSPAFRAEILAQSRRDNAAEIQKGLAWLAAAGTPRT